MKRYTVLTYIINNYEKVHEIKNKDPEAEYLLITDDKNCTSGTWTVVYDADLEGLSTFDKCYAIRFNCFKYCHTNICVRIDGSIEILHSLKPLIDVFENGNYDACLMPHPFHHNFIDEYNIWVQWRGYDKAQAERCIESMRKRGYDFNYKGLFQCCFSIQRKGELTDKIDKMTLDYLKELGIGNNIERIDQIPFSYILNTYFSNIKILPVSEQILRSYYLQWYKHNSTETNDIAFYDLRKDNIKYMFNKPVKCLYATAPLLEYAVLDTNKDTIEISLPKNKKIAVHIHIFYIDLLNELIIYLNNIPVLFDLFISIPENVQCNTRELNQVLADIKNVNVIDIQITPNVGRDIAPLLCTFGNKLKQYDYFAHLHTKKTLEDITLKDWREHILSHIMGSPAIVTQILNSISNNTGMVAPPDYSSCWDVSGWSSNLKTAQDIINKSSLNINLEKEYPVISFPQGTMFWARTDFLKNFFELPLKYQDFPKEPIARDGTKAHALERLFFVWGRDTGMKVQKFFISKEEYKCWVHMKAMMVNRECYLQDAIKHTQGIENNTCKTRKHLKTIRALIYGLSISFITIIILTIYIIQK